MAIDAPANVVAPVPPLATGKAVPDNVIANVPLVVIGEPATDKNDGTVAATLVTVPVPALTLTVTSSPELVAVTVAPTKLIVFTPLVMLVPSSLIPTAPLVDIVLITLIFSAKSGATTSPTLISCPVDKVITNEPSKSILASVTDTPSLPSIPFLPSRPFNPFLPSTPCRPSAPLSPLSPLSPFSGTIDLATSSCAVTLFSITLMASTIKSTLSWTACSSCWRIATKVSSILLIADNFSSNDESAASMLWISSLILAILQPISQFFKKVLFYLRLSI